MPGSCTALDYTLVFSGNPNLDPEESETLNFGVAWKPVDSIELTVDYWDIDQEKKIDEVPFGFLYQTFCTVQNSPVCVRSAPTGGRAIGSLQSINTSFINIGKQTAKGVDLGGYFGFDLAGGQMTLALNYSRLLTFERVELNAAGTGFVTRALEGEYEYPEDRAMASADWGTDSWGAYLQINYVGPFEDHPDANDDGVLDFDTVTTPEVDAFTTVNLQFRYTGFDKVKLLVGVDNVFDEGPPFAYGDGDTDVYGYVQSQHSPRGRFWNAKAIFSF